LGLKRSLSDLFIDENFFVNRILFFISFAFIYLSLFACEQKIKGGEIIIRNDILDKEYNSFVIDKLVSKNGALPFKKLLQPGDVVVLPFKDIRKMRFSRRYEDHSKVYEVECPNNFDSKITLKLIDIHSNRMGGGCVLRKRGEMSPGGLVKWE